MSQQDNQGQQQPQQQYIPQQDYPPQQQYPPQQGYQPQQGQIPQQGYNPNQGQIPPQQYQQQGYQPQGQISQQLQYVSPQQPLVGQNPYGQQGGQQYMIPQQQQQYAVALMGLDALAQLPSLWIKQKIEMFEIMTGIETPNVYKVYPGDQNGQRAKYNQQGQKQKALFKCKEKSECCQRICCKGACRGFQMQIKHYQKGQFGSDFQNMFALGDREFKCFFLCMNRPFMDVRVNDPQDQAQGREPSRKIGRVEWPFMICEVGLDIYGADDQLKYKIRGDLCQAGIVCKGFPCETCQQAFFHIYDTNGTQLTPMTKWSKGCFKSAVSDADNFSVVFPKNATPEDKALLFHAVLMLDYCYFEENSNNNNQHGQRY